MALTPGDVVCSLDEGAEGRLQETLHQADGRAFGRRNSDESKWRRKYVVVRVIPKGFLEGCPEMVQLIPFSAAEHLSEIAGVPSYPLLKNDLCDNPQFPYKEPTYIVVGVSGVLRTDEIHRELGRQIAPDVIQPISVLNRKLGKFVMKAIGEIWPTEKVGPIRTYLAMFCKKRTESEADAPSNPELPVIR